MMIIAGPTSLQAQVDLKETVEQLCLSCHNADNKKGELNLAALSLDRFDQNQAVWEKVTRRLRSRQMPPADKQRPDEKTYVALVNQLETSLDKLAAAKPNPGRTETIRRLTRTEYQNAIRDLLHLDIDAASMLPPDEASHGFDNVTVGEMSSTRLDRYLSAAQKISRLAVGGVQKSIGGETIRIKPDITQEDRVDGLPPGTRGGALIKYTFPRDGDYDLQIRLTRDRNELVEGLNEPHDVIILIDREIVKRFTVSPPKADKDYEKVDAHLNVRLPVKAGPHNLGVTFVKKPTHLIETLRQPYQARFNMHRHPRQAPALYQVSIAGPFADRGPGDTPSRRRIFTAIPKSVNDEELSANTILATIMRRAFRRPINDADLQRILPFYREARRDGNFDSGIESALSAILVSREFLLRVESVPAHVKSGENYKLSEVELASRLSFFLWSSIPDDELLVLAEKNQLSKTDVLKQQTLRMLIDPRSRTLATNFADQWLHLRNLESLTPDGRLFPDFDDNLRQAFRTETEWLFATIVQENRPITDLLQTDRTWLNDRLAKHYGIPHVYGPQFREVLLPRDANRGGLLRHGSVLTVTSYATRTSPVLRGKWVLENLLGTPPPPAPPNVPALDDNTVSASLPIRERLVQHRANAACAKCHNLIDPPGFALENYDAVGRWRTTEEGRPVDHSGGLPDGSQFNGIAGIEAALLKRPELLATTLTEKLMTYALGRGVEPFDGPAIRGVVRKAAENEYRFANVIVGIVESVPFQMRTSP
jgi:hypothetical protein